MTSLDIDDLVRETEATEFDLTAGNSHGDLDDELQVLYAFQLECEGRLSALATTQDRTAATTSPTTTKQGITGAQTQGSDVTGKRRHPLVTQRDGESDAQHDAANTGENDVDEATLTEKTDPAGSQDEGEAVNEGRLSDSEPDEGTRQARELVAEVAKNLATLPAQRDANSESRSVRPRVTSSTHWPACGHSDIGHQFAPRQRPQSDIGVRFDMVSLDRELTNLLAMTEEPRRRTGSVGVNVGGNDEVTRPSIAPNPTQQPKPYGPAPPKPPRTSITNNFSIPFLTRSSESLKNPASPNEDEYSVAPRSAHREDKRDHHFFATLREGVRHLAARRSFSRKKKGRTLVISNPTDFRQLTATTSIKPNADPLLEASLMSRGTADGGTLTPDRPDDHAAHRTADGREDDTADDTGGETADQGARDEESTASRAADLDETAEMTRTAQQLDDRSDNTAGDDTAHATAAGDAGTARTAGVTEEYSGEERAAGNTAAASTEETKMEIETLTKIEGDDEDDAAGTEARDDQAAQ